MSSTRSGSIPLTPAGAIEVHGIAATVEACDVALAPHRPLGPIALAACLRSMPSSNALVRERSLNGHDEVGDRPRYLADRSAFGYADGYVPALEGPGPGVEVAREAVEAGAETGHD